MSTLVTSSTHSGSAPEHQATQVSLSTGVHMSQFAPTDPRRYSTVTVIPLFNSILTTHLVVTCAEARL